MSPATTRTRLMASSVIPSREKLVLCYTRGRDAGNSWHTRQRRHRLLQLSSGVSGLEGGGADRELIGSPRVPTSEALPHPPFAKFTEPGSWLVAVRYPLLLSLQHWDLYINSGFFTYSSERRSLPSRAPNNRLTRLDSGPLISEEAVREHDIYSSEDLDLRRGLHFCGSRVCSRSSKCCCRMDALHHPLEKFASHPHGQLSGDPNPRYSNPWPTNTFPSA